LFATPQGGADICVADANQVNVYWQIAENLPGPQLAPTWSSTNKIAFHHIEGGGNPIQDYVLYTVNPDGSGLARVIPGSHESDWSPDGSKLVYEKLELSTHKGLFIANADGSNERQLTTAGIGTEPSWSPDGSKISFRGDDIYTVNVDGSNLTNITNTGEARFEGSPDWGFVRP
jgi:Tol biopolymer transport system component